MINSKILIEFFENSKIILKHSVYFQALGASNSAYSIMNQHSLNPVFSKGIKEEATFDQVEYSKLIMWIFKSLLYKYYLPLFSPFSSSLPRP